MGLSIQNILKHRIFIIFYRPSTRVIFIIFLLIFKRTITMIIRLRTVYLFVINAMNHYTYFIFDKLSSIQIDFTYIRDQIVLQLFKLKVF